uniref:hypothetical protein n=1 Tax=Pararhizobium sp. IMCC3301 TaxID=3067904 RepID=UPI0027424922|nr:hypothetical protein [Pararhizobium sp. IMCC3301]
MTESEMRLAGDNYLVLSDGDKSCVAGVIEHEDSKQMTTIGSPHDVFYQALEALDWAEKLPVPDQLKEFDFCACWTLTPLGRHMLPEFLPAVIERHRHEASRRS